MKDATMQAYIDAVSQTLDLTIAEAHRPGVEANLRAILAQAAPLMALSLAVEDEVATVFRA